MKLLKIGILFSVVALFITCGKKESEPPAPEASLLVAPAKDEVCFSGKVISDLESTIEFKWSAAPNAETYELSIKNLQTNEIFTHLASTTSLELTLKRNVPYSWFVTSKSSKSPKVAVSPTWKFYNSGKGITSYPPFPAEIIAPTFGQKITAINNKISLQWRGSDSDNDIVNYDVYFGTSKTPSLTEGKITASTLTNIPVNASTTYYWKIITRDSNGNTSDSGVYSFSVN